MIRSSVITAAALATAALALAAPALAGAQVSRAAGDLTRYPGQVPIADTPEGATARVHSVATADGRTIVTLHVSGMESFAHYGVHAHVNPCGSTGGAAGSHFQHVLDPVTPSVDPDYANPENEIWLDLSTNHAGNGHARSVVAWQFSPERRPQSVVIHEKPTLTGAGQAGTAGKRIACLTVPF